jgi:hypothetical protein
MPAVRGCLESHGPIYPLVNVHRKRTGKIHHVSWENSLFRLGHFQVRKLLVITRYPTHIPINIH